MSDFLLEIGAENIPASYIAPAMRQLGADVEALLEQERLNHDGVTTAATPRRLVVMVSQLGEKQNALEELVTGPPVSRAFDDNGKPTRAAEGFARSQGVAVEKLRRVDTDKGAYLGVQRRLARRASTTILRERLPELIAGLKFPRSMKWEASGVRFARPVRWIVCLYGSKVVRFRFADVTSGNRTYGRPWIRGETAAVRSAGSYHAALGRLGIIVDAEKRGQRIVELAERAAAKEKLKVVPDAELIEELSQMVENPRVVVGEFPRRYLELPAEVVRTAMRSHQRYIALSAGRGKLAPRFITFTDGAVRRPAEVRRGNEKVLRARLEDAGFYWREDLKRGVDGLADELDRIVFIEGLGTIGEKARRVEKVALHLSGQIDESVRPAADQISRVARIAKADLASEMIKDGKEFTRLQGVIGAHYAVACGESREVANAVRDHYLPRTPKEAPPESMLALVVGVADRIDTICGCFIAGFKPSGSQDPYALRRGANGLIRMIDPHPEVTLDTLAAVAFDAYSAGDEARRDALAFLEARAAAYLKEGGVPYDTAEAVAAVAWNRPGVALRRAHDIARLRGDAVFERLITGVKRVGNILDAGHRRTGLAAADVHSAIIDGGELGGIGSFAPDRFEDPAEGQLLEAVRRTLPALEAHEGKGDFSALLAALSSLADPIDRYFESVLVNCEDQEVRENRHRFLAAIFGLFARFADFSRIVE